MPSSDQLSFVAYLEPKASTVEWYRETLHQLWHYGLGFSPPWKNVLSWEEELHYQPERVIAGTNHPHPEARLPLPQWFEDAAAQGSGTLHMYDKGVALLTTFQPCARHASQALDALSTLGKIVIRYNRALLNPEHSEKSDLLPDYLQAWVAHIHWAEICCMLFKPLYALSYQQGDEVQEVAFASGEREHIEMPLLEQRHPNLKPLLVRTRLQYFGPQLLTEALQKELRQLPPYQLTEYLPTGGYMIIPRAEPLHYGFGIAYNFLNQAREAYERSETEQDELEGDKLIERGNPLFDIYRQLLQ